MKNFVFFLFVIGFSALNLFAQTPNFSGEWTLEKGKSKMDERQAAMIESQSLKVEQTEREVKVTVTTKQAGNQGGQRADIGGGGNTYLLNGQEFNNESQSQIGTVLTKTKGEIKDGKLNLQSVRTVDAPMGQITITTKETWELSADGKTLTVKSTRPGRDGAEMTTETVFTKS